MLICACHNTFLLLRDYHNGLPLCVDSSIWDHGTKVLVEVRPPTDTETLGTTTTVCVFLF